MSYERYLSLDGKVAFVTGGAGILGSRFSAALSSMGAKVAIADIDGKKAAALADGINLEKKGSAIGLECDVSSPCSVKEALRRAVLEFGEVHILGNNAATKTQDLDSYFEPFEEYSLDAWKKVMSVNVDGMFLVAQAVGSQMAAQGTGGSIIQTASIYGVMGPDNRIYEGSSYMGRRINTPAVYSASKGAVVALTKYLATYWAEKEIRVNTITPGGVESGQNAEFTAKYSDRVPLRRMARADDIVGAFLYLASDASSYVTGQNLIVDGGLSAW